MRILIITPKYKPTISGNSITAERIAETLSNMGHEVQVILPESYPITGFQPDIVHLLHAIKSYRDDIAEPYIVTLTGTDINTYGKSDPLQLQKNLSRAKAVTVLKEEDIPRLQDLGIMHPHIFAVQQSVVHGDEEIDLRKEFKIKGRLMLLPSGFRAVKDPLFAVKECEGVGTLLILGETYDDDIHGQCEKEWVRCGKIPHAQMRSAYEQADVVLNTSDSEGQSNAVLEAMSLGKLVLASDVPGNEIVPAQYRFRKEPGELKSLLRRYLGSGKQSYNIVIPSPEEEAQKYLDIYAEAVSQDS